jgi:adenylate/guanylate cyclase family protein
VLVFEDISREKRIKSTLTRYMAKDIVDKVLDDPEIQTLGGVRGKATILFSDIREFTGLAESLTVEQTVDVLNQYFTIKVDVIFQHGGVLDKYIGDAFVTRAIDHLAVKGKSQAIQIFEVLGEKNYRLSEAEKCFNKGLERYRRGEFKKASVLFDQGAKDDGPCRTYLSRCRHFLKFPPPPDWDGIWIAETK